MDISSRLMSKMGPGGVHRTMISRLLVAAAVKMNSCCLYSPSGVAVTGFTSKSLLSTLAMIWHSAVAGIEPDITA